MRCPASWAISRATRKRQSLSTETSSRASYPERVSSTLVEFFCPGSVRPPKGLDPGGGVPARLATSWPDRGPSGRHLGSRSIMRSDTGRSVGRTPGGPTATPAESLGLRSTGTTSLARGTGPSSSRRRTGVRSRGSGRSPPTSSALGIRWQPARCSRPRSSRSPNASRTRCGSEPMRASPPETSSASDFSKPVGVGPQPAHHLRLTSMPTTTGHRVLRVQTSGTRGTGSMGYPASSPPAVPARAAPGDIPFRSREAGLEDGETGPAESVRARTHPPVRPLQAEHRPTGCIPCRARGLAPGSGGRPGTDAVTRPRPQDPRRGGSADRERPLPPGRGGHVQRE